MRCVRPIWIDSPHKIYGNEVPCGRCYACLTQRRNIWTFRLLQELRVAESAYFVTLTYSEETVPLIKDTGVIVTNLVKSDLQKFFKKLRRKILETEIEGERFLKKTMSGYSPKLRYMACGEYGPETDRAHYHVLMYNLPIDYIEDDPVHKEQFSPMLEEIWSKGNVTVSEVTQERAHYVSKHNILSLITPWHWHERQKPFTLMSRNPGIGNNYVNEQTKNYYNRVQNSYTRLKKGYTQPIGRYYKDKIWPKEEHEGGLPIYPRERDNATKKAIEYGKSEDERLFNQAVRQADGDILEALRYLHESTTVKHQYAIEKIKRNLKKGRKL